MRTRGEDRSGEARLPLPVAGQRGRDAAISTEACRGGGDGARLGSARLALARLGLARPGAAQAERERAPAAEGRCGFPPRASPGRRAE